MTGVVLLLRAMLEGNYCARSAVRAAGGRGDADLLPAGDSLGRRSVQFRSVLFRESERLDMGLWLKHLMRDREDTPSAAMAVFCGVLILLIQFFMGFAMNSALPDAGGFHDLLVLVMISQLVVILTPALLMTVMLTRSAQQTLLLRRPPWLALPAAALLAVTMHPAAARFGELVQYLYPIRGEISEQLNNLFSQAPGVWQLLLLMALTPAICEELAFRGFILSGLRHIGHKWWAIVISSVFFGILHGVLQQSIVASTVGLVIGYLAVQSGSIFPCMLFHLVHNSLTVVSAVLSPEELGYNPLPEWIARDVGGAYAFSVPAVVLSGLLSIGILAWFRSLPYDRTAEETLQDCAGTSDLCGAYCGELRSEGERAAHRLAGNRRLSRTTDATEKGHR